MVTLTSGERAGQIYLLYIILSDSLDLSLDQEGSFQLSLIKIDFLDTFEAT